MRPNKDPDQLSRIVPDEDDAWDPRPPTNVEVEVVDDGPRETDSTALVKKAPLPVKQSVEIIPQAKETQRHLKAYNYWLEQHRSGISAAECDEKAAKYGEISVSTLRLWKAQFGWIDRRDLILNADRAEETIQLLMKNDTIEKESLDLIVRYIRQFKASATPLDERRVAVFERLVKFAQQNKRDISAIPEESRSSTTTGVAVIIKH